MNKASQYTQDFIRQSSAFILDEDESSVTVAVTDTTTQETKDNISLSHEKKVIFTVLEKDDFDSRATKLLCREKDSSGSEEKISYASSESRTINLVNTIFLDAVKADASDIHIECSGENARIRYRINGSLVTAFTVSREEMEGISSRIKVLANLNILEHRLPQDGRICVNAETKSLEFRVSIIPLNTGESIVLRILGRSAGGITLDSLGFNSRQLKEIRKMISIPHGLILISGPTGSGKSTTLNAIMNELKNDSLKIISIEDPVEYMMEGISQIQVNEAAGLRFDAVLSRVLRHDPDIIMVGEIRDEQTARLCVRAALTGHLVLSTVHTNDSLDIIQRLMNMGIELYMISAVLKGAVAQRLVKTRDENQGRTVISETFILDDESRDFLFTRPSKQDMELWFRKRGMKFLRQDAEEKIRRGIILKSEARKEIEFA